MNKLKAARLNAGLTQKQAAERCGVPFRTYQNWEYGTRKPPEYVLAAILEKLKEGR